MSLLTQHPRDKAITIRVSEQTYKKLDQLTEKHNLSQADVFEALIEQEYRESRRLKGKISRRKRK
jgi:predicted transcriptional regulator